LQALGVSNAQEMTDAKKWQTMANKEEKEKPEPPPFPAQPGQQPPRPEGEEAEVVEQIAAMIKENLGRGDVGAQEAAEWALAQLLEETADEVD